MEEKLLRAEDPEEERNLPFQTRRNSSNSSGDSAFNLDKQRDKFSFCAAEKLKSKKLIDQLFNEGKSISNNGFTLIYLATSLPSAYPVQAGFSVPKRHFKRAVDRNRIKRQMREVYRQNKFPFYEHLTNKNLQMAIMWIYKGKSLPEFTEVGSAMQFCLKKASAL